MSKLAVIGIGSPYGNDTLGWQVIEKLRGLQNEKSPLPDNVQLIACDRPGIQLIALLQDLDSAILVDAIENPAREGELHWIAPDEISANHAAISCHGCGVYEALALANILGELPRELRIVGLCIDAASPMPIAPARIDALANDILDHVQRCHSQISVTPARHLR
jgi:hydrogenase maturation protease